jgi:hypothetical protein
MTEMAKQSMHEKTLKDLGFELFDSGKNPEEHVHNEQMLAHHAFLGLVRPRMTNTPEKQARIVIHREVPTVLDETMGFVTLALDELGRLWVYRGTFDHRELNIPDFADVEQFLNSLPSQVHKGPATRQ